MKSYGRVSMLAATALCSAAAAQTHESDFSVSAGAKAWSVQWTSFSYATAANGVRFITQAPAKDKVVLVPVLSVRYRDFIGSVSGYQSTRYLSLDGTVNIRNEFDANLGYLVAPGVAVTLGYKKLAQKAEYRYEPAGLVAGISASASLGGAFAMYGALGVGKLKTPASADAKVVQFDADYRLSEVGLAYNMTPGRLPRALALTLGYRMQVLNSKEALGAQDARDLSHGLTLGFIATF